MVWLLISIILIWMLSGIFAGIIYSWLIGSPNSPVDDLWAMLLGPFLVLSLVYSVCLTLYIAYKERRDVSSDT